ncbi:hypothetical protein [Anthocerotibacter panamensis]|uniref:hypothetical protein n=1 Tax=Anthocerotibacter panamensis TaxID=2857077 RepID=UPI001C401CE8|nr:hypothetical protein [Anthocerotibacter panamensis]
MSPLLPSSEPNFEPSQEELWNQLCAEVMRCFPEGTTCLEGDAWNQGKIQVQFKKWTITLDFFSPARGHSSTTGNIHTVYTRVRAPYHNEDQFRFKIYRKGFFSDLGKRFGMQDVAVGDPDFDEAFIVQGNNSQKLRALFGDPEIRRLLMLQPEVYLEVRDDEGWFGQEFPDGVDELAFQIAGRITDVGQLKALWDLFAAILDRLCHLGYAYESNPRLGL